MNNQRCESGPGDLRVAQVGLVSAVGGSETLRWYEDTLGLRPSGAMDLSGGPDDARVLGVSEDPELRLAWLVDDNDLFQIEVADFERPRSKPKPDTWGPRDIGYSLITIWVSRFDAAFGKASSTGAVVAEPTGAPGERRAVVTDPDGTLIELIEKDVVDPKATPGPGDGVAVRAVRASVADLAGAVAFFVDGLGLEALSDPHVLHGPEHEALWGLEGEAPALTTFQAGDLFLELAQYDSPRGAPRPPGYEISDVGIMKVGFATGSGEACREISERMAGRGYEVRPFEMGDDLFGAYMTDGHGLTVELLFAAPAVHAAIGFAERSER